MHSSCTLQAWLIRAQLLYPTGLVTVLRAQLLYPTGLVNPCTAPVPYRPGYSVHSSCTLQAWLLRAQLLYPTGLVTLLRAQLLYPTGLVTVLRAQLLYLTGLVNPCTAPVPYRPGYSVHSSCTQHRPGYSVHSSCTIKAWLPHSVHQGCGSGSGSVLDPYSIGSLDPDPYSEYGSRSGSRRAKMTQKSRQ